MANHDHHFVQHKSQDVFMIECACDLENIQQPDVDSGMSIQQPDVGWYVQGLVTGGTSDDVRTPLVGYAVPRSSSVFLGRCFMLFSSCFHLMCLICFFVATHVADVQEPKRPHSRVRFSEMGLISKL